MGKTTPELWYISTKTHGVTPQTSAFFVSTTFRTSNHIKTPALTEHRASKVAIQVKVK